jgi:opacity protein-like surface antigen
VSEFLADDENSTTALAWNYGAGVKAALNNRIGVRGDLRYFNAREVAPDHFRIYVGLVIRRLGR